MSNSGIQLYSEPQEHVPQASLMALVEAGYRCSPGKAMIVCGDRSLTYGEAFAQARSLAWYIRFQLHVDYGCTALVSMPNRVEFPVIVAALQTMGIRICMVSNTGGRNDYAHAVDLMHPDVAIVATSAAVEHLRSLDVPFSILTVDGTAAGGDGTIEHAMRMVPRDQQLELTAWSGEDTAIVLFSSGSTGKPKAIANRSSSFKSNAYKLSSALGVNRDDVLYVPVPFAHVYGIIGMYAALLQGATMVTISKYYPEASLSAQANSRVTVYFGVATMYVREMRVNKDGGWNLSSLRLGMLAGAPCPESAIREFESRYDCTLVQSYGMTETAATLTVNSAHDPLPIRAKSVGVPIPGVQIKLDSRTGEILVKTPALMIGIVSGDGYKLVDVDEDGWLHSGDIGRFDDEGRLYIVGRIKDIIIRGGINVFPSEVESVYQGHPDIEMSCLVGYPDAELGERTCLCVVPKSGHSINARAMRDYSKGVLEKCMLPDTVMPFDAFPQLANGKIDKKALRAQVEAAMSSIRRPGRSA